MLLQGKILSEEGMRSRPYIFKNLYRLGSGGAGGGTDCGISLGETLEILVHALYTLNTESVPIGIHVSSIKKKIQIFFAFFDRNIDLQPPGLVQGENVSFIDSFVYLRSPTSNGGWSCQ